MHSLDRYAVELRWDDESNGWRASASALPHLSAWGVDRAAALQMLEQLIDGTR